MKNSSQELIKIRAANGAEDELKIFEFNHEIFANEIGQHSATQNGQLVDAFHPRNHYLIAEISDNLAGMICLTSSENGKFSVDSKMDSAILTDEIRNQAIEIRLLAVKKAHRGTIVTLKLITQAASLAVSLGYKYALISAIDKQIALYLKFGFAKIAPAKNIKGVFFTPMILGLKELEAAISSRPSIAKYLNLNSVTL